MSGDDLSVQLFIGATAITVLALAVSQAGWKHLWFVRALFGVAFVLAACAIFWKPISDELPHVKEIVSELASNSFSWFSLLLIGFGLVFVLDFGARIGWFGPNKKVKQIQFWNKIFTNEIIELDNREYYNCSFNNCTFRFGGGRHMLINCQMSPAKRFETPNTQSANAISIMKVLGLLEPGFSQNWKHIPSDYFK